MGNKSLTNFLNIFFKAKEPIIKDNTFLIWEPCSTSHSEVVPGYTKYLRDMGYHVSIMLTPKNFKDGLFERYNDENISLNKMSQKEIRKFFLESDLSNVAGVLVTTVGKLCDEIHFDESYKNFHPNVDRSKIHFVSHEAKSAIDEGLWNENLITLRKLNYKNAKSVVVNPHFFGNVNITPKNSEVTNFISIGAMQAKRKDENLIISAVQNLYNEGIRNFKITIVGKGHLKSLPKEIRPFFDIKGRLPFNKMYEEIEKADFILNSYTKSNPKHERYNTTGTSGNFQLTYGFLKPCIMLEEFAPLNGFDENNSILYKGDEDYTNAMLKGIQMSEEEYNSLQNNLKEYVDSLYKSSKDNLEKLVNHKVEINV